MNWITTGCSWSPQWQKERQRQTKVGKIYYFVSSIHFHLIDMQKCIECPRIFKDEMVHKGWHIYILWCIFIEIFCYHVNRLLVCFLKYLPNRTPIFKEKIVPKKGNFWPKLPRPWCTVQVFVRSETNATVSNFIWITNCTLSMSEGFVWPFPILLNP